MSTTVVDETTTSDFPTSDEGEKTEAETDAGGSALFDPARYDDPELQLPKIEGQSVDRIRLNFSGSVDLDRSDAADVALFRRLAFGKGAVTLSIEGVAKKSGGALLATSREGEEELVVGEKQIKVTSVYARAPEEL